MELFDKVSESKITKAIVDNFHRRLKEYIESDVIVVGGGPSGLMAAKELADSNIKILIIEANNYLGGGFWLGGYLMNGVTVRKPADKVLDELNIPYEESDEGVCITPGPHACSKLIAAACDAGAEILNMTKFDDVVLRENDRVAGVVINWMPVSNLPRAVSCVDPIALESKIVIDATGHDAWVCESLRKRELLRMKTYGPMWVEKSEDLVVEKTQAIHPGLIVTGMAVSTVFGIPRMGPTFGAMLLSGRKAAEIAKDLLSGKDDEQSETPINKEEMKI